MNRPSAVKASKKFQRGVALFNAHKFFQAHEVWEELWLHETGPEKTFLQGLIQVAAAFHHYSRGNRRGAKLLLAAGTSKLGLYPDNHDGLALAEFLSKAARWSRTLEAGENSELRHIPKLRPALSPIRRTKSEGISVRQKGRPTR